MVPHLYASDPLTHFFHDAGALVSKNDRGRMRHQPVHHVQVTVTETAGHISDENLALSRRLKVEVFDYQLLADFSQHSRACLHVYLPELT